MKTTINIIKNRPIINVLGEVCWGLRVEQFEEKIGTTKHQTEVLLKYLLQKEKCEVAEVELNDTEVEILRRSLNEVEREIEEWEFETREGITIEEMNDIEIFKKRVISFSELQPLFHDLLTGRLSRKAITPWAARLCHAAENNRLEYLPPKEKERIMQALDFLKCIDLKKNADEYVHSTDAIKSFKDTYLK